LSYRNQIIFKVQNVNKTEEQTEKKGIRVAGKNKWKRDWTRKLEEKRMKRNIKETEKRKKRILKGKNLSWRNAEEETSVWSLRIKSSYKKKKKKKLLFTENRLKFTLTMIASNNYKLIKALRTSLKKSI
jgi:hypothetical protein